MNQKLIHPFKIQKIFFLKYLIAIFIYPLTSFPILGQEICHEVKFSPIPSWVKQYRNPVADSNCKRDLVLVHFETQFNHTTKELFRRNFYYLNTTEGLNQIKSYYDNYKPLYQTFRINRVNIYRKNTIIELKNQLHVECKLESKEIGGAVYDIDAQIKIFFNQAKVGDLLEIAYTIEGLQPDLYDCLNYNISPKLNELRGKSYFRIIASGNKTIRYTAININVRPIRKNFDGLSTLEFITDNNERLDDDQITPSWYSNINQIYIYDKIRGKRLLISF